jgi:hypothetical protein
MSARLRRADEKARLSCQRQPGFHCLTPPIPKPLQFEESFFEVTREPESIPDIKPLIEAALGISDWPDAIAMNHLADGVQSPFSPLFPPIVKKGVAVMVGIRFFGIRYKSQKNGLWTLDYSGSNPIDDRPYDLPGSQQERSRPPDDGPKKPLLIGVPKKEREYCLDSLKRAGVFRAARRRH